MKTKLTLTIERDILEKAKLYAKSNNISLSNLVEDHLEKTVKETADFRKLSRRLQGLVGKVTLTDHFDEKAELYSYFKIKHGF